MNWVSNKPFPKNGTIKDEYDMCEHVESDNSLANWIFCEDDAFGPVMRNVVCKECKEETFKAIAESTDYCHDCGDEVKVKDLLFWRCYQFSESEGDEELPICVSCQTNSKHQERVKHKQRLIQQDIDEEEDDWEEEEPDYDDPVEDDEDDKFFDENDSDFQTHLNQQYEEEQDHSLEDDGINDRD